MLLDWIARQFMSESAKAILWLWRTDREGWVIGSHAFVHPESGKTSIQDAAEYYHRITGDM